VGTFLITYTTWRVSFVLKGETQKEIIDSIVSGSLVLPEFLSKDAKEIITLLLSNDPA
jgi:hypothetical protein